jgi:hypothetical protein
MVFFIYNLKREKYYIQNIMKARKKRLRRARKEKEKEKEKVEEEEEIVQHNEIWDNPFARVALEAMTAEQKEQYLEIGENIYSSIDFEDSKILNPELEPMSESVAYISSALKSGLHPDFLSEEEIAVLKDVYGDEWFTKFGYTREDIGSLK